MRNVCHKGEPKAIPTMKLFLGHEVILGRVGL